MFDQIYPTEFQLNKANSSDIEAPFWGLNLSITNDKVCSKIYDMEASLRAKQKFVLLLEYKFKFSSQWCLHIRIFSKD